MSDAHDPQPRDVSTRPERRPDVDWLRALAVWLVVPYHASLLFGGPSLSHISTGEKAPWLLYFAGFVHQWHMPLLFVLSGMSTWFALRFRTPSRYAAERVKRLLVPLVFGTLVIVPPEVYYQRLAEGKFTGSYLAFYPHFFNGIYGATPDGNFTYDHLWFIAYLLLFSLLSLPLLVWLNSRRGQGLTSKLAGFCKRPGAIFLLAIPVAVTESLFRAKYPGSQALVSDWANFTTYLYLFVLGFVLCGNDRFTATIRGCRWPALACGLVSTEVGIGLVLTGNGPAPDYSLGWILFMILKAFNMWFWLLALLGAGLRFLDVDSRLLPYVRQAAYPFYVLHQTVLIMIGYHVMKWHMSAAARFSILVIATTIATALIYDLAVRRLNVTRFLFGMRSKPSAK
ncbi:MAG: acyltransferase [Phycisphaerae bacterium]|nr:acyltransferase [Phycisphaerae bacterium]